MLAALKVLILLWVIMFQYGGVLADGEEGAPAEDTEATDDDSEGDAADEGPISCFQCNATEECGAEQNEGNGTSTTECDLGDHCWIWKIEEDDEVTYRRDCGDPCTDETRELDCLSNDNRTECKECCSEGFCNAGLLNKSSRILANVNMIIMLSLCLSGRLVIQLHA